MCGWNMEIGRYLTTESIRYWIMTLYLGEAAIYCFSITVKVRKQTQLLIVKYDNVFPAPCLVRIYHEVESTEIQSDVPFGLAHVRWSIPHGNKRSVGQRRSFDAAASIRQCS